MAPSEVLLRTADLSLRSDGRTIHGVVVPYNVEATVNDGRGPYREMFAPGAFARSIDQRGHKVRLMVNHETRSLPIGKAVELVERPDGLHGAFHVSETRAGQEALTLVHDGVVDSFSVGFTGIQQKQQNGVTVRTEAALREVSLVGFPAYADALISGVRLENLSTDEIAEFLASLTDSARTDLVQALTPAADSGTGELPAPPAQHGDSLSDPRHGIPTRAERQKALRQLKLKEIRP